MRRLSLGGLASTVTAVFCAFGCGSATLHTDGGSGGTSQPATDGGAGTQGTAGHGGTAGIWFTEPSAGKVVRFLVP